MEIIRPSLETTDALVTKAIFEGDLRNRIQQPLGEACLFDSLQLQTKGWQESGEIVVFNAGVFDILHANHLLWLAHCRVLGAHEYLDRQDVARPSLEQLRAVVASNAVRLIVSVDTDERVARDKGFNEAKGNSPKPIISWENRALLLASQYISNQQGGARPLIDLITRHGDDADGCGQATCPHIDNADIIHRLEPDLAVVNGASQQTLSALSQAPVVARTKLIQLDESSLPAYHDDLLGGELKSSSIIHRARLADS